MNNSRRTIILGRIVGFYGVRGWVKIHSECRPRADIFSYQHFFARIHNKDIPLTLVEGRTQGKGLVAHFKEIVDRDSAASFIGATLLIDRDTLPPLSDNEIYWVDLIGLKVVNRAKQELGTVKNLIETGANDVLIIQNTAKEELLIPFVRNHYIDKIDLEAQTIFVDWDSSWND